MNLERNSMVELKTIGEILSVHTGKQLNRNDLSDKGLYPVINGGRTPSGYTDTPNEKQNTITISQGGESAGYVNWIDTAFWAGAHCYVVENKSNQNLRFLYHLLKNFEYVIMDSKQGAGIPGLNRKNLYSISIPIPPLSEQYRIVGILDTFSESIENLKKQIAQRRKQYEYYRDQLLDLEGKPGVELMSMSELFTFKNGLNKGKEFFGSGKPIIMFSNVFNSRYLKSSMITNRVDITDKELERIDAKIGDVFFTRTSETKEDVGYSSVLLEDVGDCSFAGFLIRARPLTDKLIPSYCKYCFSSPNIRNSIVGNSSFTTRASLTGSGLGKIDLPIPSPSQQSRIVSILDAFEESITNLEAQLSLRQKQYEYYRNKLLTFE